LKDRYCFRHASFDIGWTRTKLGALAPIFSVLSALASRTLRHFDDFNLQRVQYYCRTGGTPFSRTKTRWRGDFAELYNSMIICESSLSQRRNRVEWLPANYDICERELRLEFCLIKTLSSSTCSAKSSTIIKYRYLAKNYLSTSSPCRKPREQWTHTVMQPITRVFRDLLLMALVA
jgi:hypothetical protein